MTIETQADKDAWQQKYELLKRFTKKWEPRSDIRVTAHACSRAVQLTLKQPNKEFDGKGFKGKFHYHTTGKRNVGTMREVAQAILDACDFVDASNPTWASQPPASEIVWVDPFNGEIVTE